jgi:hypothetical protein
MSEQPIKPCPFCGRNTDGTISVGMRHVNYADDGEEFWVIECDNCQLTVSGEDETRRAWERTNFIR